MKDFFVRLWTDQAYFVAGIRGLIALTGALLASGTIPTGVEGLGAKWGPLITALSVAIPAGQKNKVE